MSWTRKILRVDLTKGTCTPVAPIARADSTASGVPLPPAIQKGSPSSASFARSVQTEASAWISTGVVRAVGWHQWGGGNRVEVDHGNGLVTTYNHLEGIGVKTGDLVGAGQAIATVGTSGGQDTPALYFAIRQQGPGEGFRAFGRNVSAAGNAVAAEELHVRVVEPAT